MSNQIPFPTPMLSKIFSLLLYPALMTIGAAIFTAANAQPLVFQKAADNGALAAEGFQRCEHFVQDWLTYADPASKLIPRNLHKDVDLWNANDCAADNYPFMVLTSFYTNQARFNGVMREMLKNERRLTSRVKSLPDDYSFSKKGFMHDEVNMGRIVFGTAEYCKDGLMPLTEWLGHSPWSERMMEMLRDLDEQIDVANELQFSVTVNTEVNGELLQVLSRVYWMTGEKRFLDWAVKIGDHFLLGEGYPLKSVNNLRLRDHGCELISGLCELYATLHYADKQKKETYRAPLYKLLDHVLDHGRNEDGLFYNAINPLTGQVLDKALSDSWGYNLNGYYTVFMVDGTQRYKDAVVKVFGNLNKYRNYNWENGSQDGYADAIESALNLYNRIPHAGVAQWIDSEIGVMWALQDSAVVRYPMAVNARDDWKRPGSGVIEGWHGDGNFARTTIMYNLWKSKGTYVQPLNHGVTLGGEMKGDSLILSLGSPSANWDGKLYFDKARHSEVMKMPIDWPRINQFPEWFTVDPKKKYQVSFDGGQTNRRVTGDELLKGIKIDVKAGVMKRMVVVAL
jgi:hypothetical protein